MDAMERQVVELGYDAATTRSVAAEAGTQVANLRHHFGSKAGLFTATFDRAMAVVGEVLAAHRAQVGEAVTVGSALRLWAEVMQALPRTAAFLAVAPIERARHAELKVPVGAAAVGLEAMVRAEVRRSMTLDDVDPDVLADTLIAVVFGLVAYPALIDPTASAPAILHAASAVFDRTGV